MIVQGTPEWMAMRRGKVTASRVADVIAKTKTGWGASRSTYAAELIAERLTGTTAASFTNAAMQWGTDTEPKARQAYVARTSLEVFETSFVDHPEIAMSGASPDGLVGSSGLIEIKCPNTSTHLDTLLSETVPGKYVIQMQWQMACTGTDWCDFVSFDPRMPPEMSLFIRRVERDVSHILELESDVSAFLGEIDAKVSALIARYRQQVAA